MILVTGEGCILMIPLGGGVGGSSEEHLEEGIKGSVFACLGTGGSSKLFNWYPERRAFCQDKITEKKCVLESSK